MRHRKAEKRSLTFKKDTRKIGLPRGMGRLFPPSGGRPTLPRHSLSDPQASAPAQHNLGKVKWWQSESKSQCDLLKRYLSGANSNKASEARSCRPECAVF